MMVTVLMICGYMMKKIFTKHRYLLRIFDDPRLKVICQDRLVYFIKPIVPVTKM